MTTCLGNLDDHCCHLGRAFGGACRYVRDDGPLAVNRRWVCTLREELGSWSAVHSDPRYLADVKPALDAMPSFDGDCGDWPPPGETCGTCGVTGDG
jgi:hypothetical protein